MSYRLTNAGDMEAAFLARAIEVDQIVRNVSGMTFADMSKDNMWLSELKRRARKLKEPWSNVLAAARRAGACL